MDKLDSYQLLLLLALDCALNPKLS